MSKYQKTVNLTFGTDFDCVLMASFGRSNRSISKETGLTFGQINYRLKKSMTLRKDYRDGLSSIAKQLYQAGKPLIESKLRKELANLNSPKRKLLKK